MKQSTFFFLAIFLVFFSLASCVRPKIENWDQDSFSVCCNNKTCDTNDLEEKAQNHCEGTLILLGGHKSQGPSIVQDDTIIHTKVQCSVYRCDGVFSPQLQKGE